MICTIFYLKKSSDIENRIYLSILFCIFKDIGVYILTKSICRKS